MTSDNRFGNSLWVSANKLYLQPGALYVGSDYQLVQTLLGSCVSVCASHSPSGNLAICHLVLPGGRGKVAPDYRFADHTLPVLYRAVTRLAAATAWQWRLYGGASIDAKSDYFAIGRQNLSAVQQWATSQDIHFADIDTGGHQGRIIQLHQDGSVRLQYCGRAT